MSLRERSATERPQEAPGAGPTGGSRLASLREQANGYIAAGDEAIDRVLSGDSERYLSANLQRSGE